MSSVSDSEAEISTPAITWRFQQTALFIRHSQPDLLNILFLRNLKIYSFCLVDSIYGFMKWRKEISRILSVKTFDSYMSTKQLLSYRFKKQDDGAGMSTSPSVRELQMWSADPPAEVLMRVTRPRGTLKTKEKCPTMQRYRTKQQRELFRCFTVISSKALLKLAYLNITFKLINWRNLNDVSSWHLWLKVSWPTEIQCVSVTRSWLFSFSIFKAQDYFFLSLLHGIDEQRSH